MNEAPKVPSEDAHWQYQQAATSPIPKPEEQEVQWTASEFIAHEKSFGWYALFLLGALVLAAIIYLLTRDKVSTAVVPAVAIILLIAANRKPRVLDYAVTEHGLTIGPRTYLYMEFKSFSVMRQEAFPSIMLMPMRRFMPPISIYYDPQDEDRIVQAIAAYLPFEEHQRDLFDQLVDRLHL